MVEVLKIESLFVGKAGLSVRESAGGPLPGLDCAGGVGVEGRLIGKEKDYG